MGNTFLRSKAWQGLKVKLAAAEASVFSATNGSRAQGAYRGSTRDPQAVQNFPNVPKNLRPYHHQAKEALAVAEMKRLRQEAAQVGTCVAGTVFFPSAISFMLISILCFAISILSKEKGPKNLTPEVEKNRCKIHVVKTWPVVSFTRHEVQTLRARVAELEV